MKKIGILTINDNNNYGNRLQNYAVQETLRKLKCMPETIENKGQYPIFKVKTYIGNFLKGTLFKSKYERYNRFMNFNKNIKKSNIWINFENIPTNICNKFDYFITGSDQVWNPKFGRLTNIDLLSFAKNNQKISFSASFGINELPEDKKEFARKNLETFKAISVREETGKKIVEELTGRKDVEVLVDPTMLLSAEEWDKVSKKPKQLKTNKYILNYFLGNISKEADIEIHRIAKENNCDIINILDKNSPFYLTGPSEFLYLEKNAFMVCTDSFHSSVFSIIYNVPFVVFEREQKGVPVMNSRIETLLNKFKLNDRKFTGKITNDKLKANYEDREKILEKEKKKSIDFLKRALDIEE